MTLQNQPVLVADIGGTNARFALADTSLEAPLQQDSIREFVVADFPSLGDAARHYLEQIGAEARRGAGDITDLEDLPKLRSGDAHPDAPPRRPFSANRDLAEPEMVEAAVETVIVEQVANGVSIRMAVLYLLLGGNTKGQGS